MRLASLAALLACACATTTTPEPAQSTEATPKEQSIPFVARLVATDQRGWKPPPKDWGPYIRARHLDAADPAAREELERTFPDCSLSAFELDPCGSIPGGPQRYTLGISEARTRAPLAQTETTIGDEPLRLLVSVGLGMDKGVRYVESFSVYRIDPEALEPLLTVRTNDSSVPAGSDVVPKGFQNAGGWHHIMFDFREQVIRCWCLPDVMLDGIATRLYESGTTGMYLLPGVKREDLLKKPLADWPEYVWVLTLVPVGP